MKPGDQIKLDGDLQFQPEEQLNILKDEEDRLDARNNEEVGNFAGLEEEGDQEQR